MKGLSRIALLFVLGGCAGPDAARLEGQVDALTQRVQALETRTKKLEGIARRSKAGKARVGRQGQGGKAGKQAPVGGVKAGKGARQQPPEGGAPGRGAGK